MRSARYIVWVVMALSGASAAAAVWQPSPGHTQLPLWHGTVPDAAPVTGPKFTAPAGNRVAGRAWISVYRVAAPTMTVYSPQGTNTRIAVVVFAGGGYEDLAIDLEGAEVCDWLVSKAITCVLLEYRVPESGPHWQTKCDCEVDAKAPIALEDA